MRSPRAAKQHIHLSLSLQPRIYSSWTAKAQSFLLHRAEVGRLRMVGYISRTKSRWALMKAMRRRLAKWSLKIHWGMRGSWRLLFDRFYFADLGRHLRRLETKTKRDKLAWMYSRTGALAYFCNERQMAYDIISCHPFDPATDI